jgi:hypothetical protein
VTVVGGAGAVVVLGDGPAVCVVVVGGAADSLVGADEVVTLLEVTAGLCDVPAVVYFTTA